MEILKIDASEVVVILQELGVQKNVKTRFHNFHKLETQAMFTMLPSSATEPNSLLQICTLKSRTNSLFPSVAQSKHNKNLLFELGALSINVNNYKRRHTFPE